MKEVRKNLILEFETEVGTKFEVKILRPMEGLNGSEIKTAMETVVATGALGDQSPVAKVAGARYDIRQVQEITLA